MRITITLLLIGLCSICYGQGYGIYKFNAESYSNFGYNIECDTLDDVFYLSYSRTCNNKSCTQLMAIERGGRIIYDTTLYVVDIFIETMVLRGDTLVVAGNDDYQSKWLIQLVDAASGDSIDLIELPVYHDMTELYISECKYFDNKYYVSGRGKIAGQGMIPMIYVLDGDWEVDTLLLMDTLQNGWVSKIDQMNDGTILAFYFTQELGGDRDYRYTVVGLDSSYEEVYRYITPQKTNTSLSSGHGTYLSKTNSVVLHSTYSENTRGSQFNHIDSVGNLLWVRNTYEPGQFSLAFHQSRNMIALSDGNFLSMGQWWDSRDENLVYRHSPYIMKIDGETGQTIWRHVFFAQNPDRETAAASGSINDAVELPNGDIAITGSIFEEDYKVLFAIVDSNGCLEPDCGFRIDINQDPVSSEEVESHAEVVIYPNPANDHITITYSSEGQLRLLNMQGQVLHQGDYDFSQHASIALHDFASGIYIARIITEEGNVVNSTIVIE